MALDRLHSYRSNSTARGAPQASKGQFMTSAVSNVPAAEKRAVGRVSRRAGLLADRLAAGARALADLATSLTDAEWQTPISATDSRPIGVVIHHVASVYPVEIQLASPLASGKAVTGVTNGDINAMNANHAVEQRRAAKAETIELLRRNSAAAEAAIRALSDEELDGAATVSLYDDAPLTCQFVLEDHAVRHSYHHLALIRAAVRR